MVPIDAVVSGPYCPCVVCVLFKTSSPIASLFGDPEREGCGCACGARRTFRAVSVSLVASAAFLLVIGSTGCSSPAPSSVFKIIDHRYPGEAQRYHEDFDECYYGIGEGGNVDIVLSRTTPGENDPRETFRQVIHIKGVWRCIPGDTVSHRTQINATVIYHIISGRVGMTFEGAGSLFYTLDKSEGTLTGALELAHLLPKRQLVSRGELFERAELTGQFQATRNERRVTRTINEMKRLFGTLRTNQP